MRKIYDYLLCIAIWYVAHNCAIQTYKCSLKVFYFVRWTEVVRRKSLDRRTQSRQKNGQLKTEKYFSGPRFRFDLCAARWPLNFSRSRNLRRIKLSRRSCMDNWHLESFRVQFPLRPPVTLKSSCYYRFQPHQKPFSRPELLRSNSDVRVYTNVNWISNLRSQPQITFKFYSCAKRLPIRHYLPANEPNYRIVRIRTKNAAIRLLLLINGRCLDIKIRSARLERGAPF